MTRDDQVIVVTGATGRQGGAVARHLLSQGWRVRGITRAPGSTASRELAALGVEMVRADMADPDAMRRACEGVHGVFIVQNPMISGADGEAAQGRNVVDAARAGGVSHLVYGSAGPGTPGTGVAAWDVKLEVAGYARSHGSPLTVLRPMAFMELMTDRDLYPAVAAWHLMPRLVGEDRPIRWLSADDVGAIAARTFAEPASYIGSDLALAGDIRTLSECRAIWRRVTGRNPRRVPMPVWLFERFVGPDLTRMWRWLATNEVNVDPMKTRTHHPNAATVEGFVQATERTPQPMTGRQMPDSSPDIVDPDALLLTVDALVALTPLCRLGVCVTWPHVDHGGFQCSPGGGACRLPALLGDAELVAFRVGEHEPPLAELLASGAGDPRRTNGLEAVDLMLQVLHEQIHMHSVLHGLWLGDTLQG